MSTGAGCPKCNADEHRLLGHVVHDYVQWWTCEVCGHEWVRWPKTHPYYPLALTLMQRANNTTSRIEVTP